MDESVVFRMSAFSEQGGRKYMEDVVEIRIEYEPTPSLVEDYPKSQRHGGEGKAEGEPDKRTETETQDPDVPAESGPVSAMWVESLSNEDSGNNTAPASEGKVAERTVDTRRSVAFFAVFDGHGGREAAHFARENLWDLLKRQRGFWSKDHSEVCAALRKGFIACHHAMWKELRKSPKLRSCVCVIYMCVCFLTVFIAAFCSQMHRVRASSTFGSKTVSHEAASSSAGVMMLNPLPDWPIP